MRSAVLLILMLCVLAPAVGQGVEATGRKVPAEEIRQELMGYVLTGVTESDNTPWRECIERGGNTVYTFRGTSRAGVMWVTEEALACFTYGGLASCFDVFETEGVYRFYGGGEVFRVTGRQPVEGRCQDATPTS